MSIPEGEITITTTEAHDQSGLQRAAETMANKLLSYRQLLLNKTGLIDEGVIATVLDTLQAQSLANAYSTTDGRPVRFFIFQLDTEVLLEMRKESSRIFPDKLARLAVAEPAYVTRLRNNNSKPYKMKNAYGKVIKINPSADDKLFLKHVIEADFSLQKYLRFPMKIRKALTRFGNPPNYPLGGIGDGQYEEQDPNYPMFVPIFNIQFVNQPADPKMFLNDYNKRYARREEEIFKGDIKRTDIFSENEISIADQCRALVDFIDGSFYQSFDLPRTTIGIVAPLFLYQVIEQNYGYNYESWLGFGPNDELMMQLGEVHQEII